MPLLEFGSEKPLTQRFSFLNLTDDTEIDGKREPTPFKHVSIVESKPSSPRTLPSDVAIHSAQTIGAEVMQAVGVVKTTLGKSKLFINLTTSSTQDSLRRASSSTTFYCSDLVEDKDKSGASCLVMTVLDVKARVNLDLDSDVQYLLKHVRLIVSLEIGSKFTIPRMRKKGKLLHVSTHHDVQTQSKNVLERPAVIEVKSASKVQETHDSKPSSVIGKHSIEKLAAAEIALPLPTRYTHHFSVPLPRSDDKGSWSVYFDSQDTTLKVLLPPREDFMTLPAALDDFRAFTKDGYLHIFFIGAP